MGRQHPANGITVNRAKDLEKVNGERHEEQLSAGSWRLLPFNGHFELEDLTKIAVCLIPNDGC
jgi:hypothetical protein